MRLLIVMAVLSCSLPAPVKFQVSAAYVPAFVCVVFSVTLPTVAPVSPFTPVIDVTVAVCERPSDRKSAVEGGGVEIVEVAVAVLVVMVLAAGWCAWGWPR